MSKHTPGPWAAVTRTNAHIEIEAPSQPGYLAKKVATVSLTNHKANARLIAAAPDMKAELEKQADTMAKLARTLRALGRGAIAEACDIAEAGARAAIAKAEGENT